MVISYILIIILAMFLKMFHANDYCQITCRKEPGQHTMCLFPGPNYAVCKQYDVSSDRLKRQMKEDMINLHNNLRNKVALGRLEKKPGASNMLQLVWDNELARIAQRAADQCDFNHDKCRWVNRFSVGQNIAIYMHSREYTNNYLKGVQAWYDEHTMYPNTNQYQSVSGTGHYTQVVWAKSRYIGCARSKYEQESMYKELIFCNYGPAGNMIGDKIYEQGSPASKCPKGYFQSKIFRGLCHFWPDGDIPGDSDHANPSSSGPNLFLLISSYILCSYLIDILNC